MKTILDPTEALMNVGKENTELHEELRQLQKTNYHLVKCLQYISEMPNEAAPVATLGLQLRPFK